MRSRVTPGWSWTIAWRLPTRRLKSVDLPTLGRPTMATVALMSGAIIAHRAPSFSFDAPGPLPYNPGGRESGGTGRRAALRTLWPQGHGGSSPPFRTTRTPPLTPSSPAAALLRQRRRRRGAAPRALSIADRGVRAAWRRPTIGRQG